MMHMNKERLFISYTTRDGIIRITDLIFIDKIFSTQFKTYIDLLHNDSINKQRRVLKELKLADKMLLILTPKVFSSPWVIKEIKYATKYYLPIQFCLYSNTTRLVAVEIKDIFRTMYNNMG